MSRRKKLPQEEIERALIADADNPDAWEEPVTVPPSSSPRPSWYGRSKHLELAAKYYVLSVLHRLGAGATLTCAQPDNVDIAAVQRSGETLTIEVRTLTGTTDWWVEPFRAQKHHFLVFVCFERAWNDPHAVPEVYIWASERLQSFLARQKKKTISLRAVASRLNPSSAWDQFTTGPAA